jgi:hypothetical protein
MGKIKGQVDYERFKKGDKLLRKSAMLAMCYQCNGYEDSNEDCLGTDCPLYEYQPYRGIKSKLGAEEALLKSARYNRKGNGRK